MKSEAKKCLVVRDKARPDADFVAGQEVGAGCLAGIRKQKSPRSRQSPNELGMDGKMRRKMRMVEGRTN